MFVSISKNQSVYFCSIDILTSIIFLSTESTFIDVVDSSFSSFVLSEFSSERQHCFLHYWAQCEISAFSLACHPFAEVSSYLFSPEIWLRIIFPIIHTYSKTLFVHLISDKLVHSNIVSCQYDAVDEIPGTGNTVVLSIFLGYQFSWISLLS